MSQFVVMKSNRYGINLRLDPDCSFRDLLDAIIEKFQESEKFFKNAKVGISFEGRRLSTDEENRIIEEIMKHTSMEIICIIDNDKEHEEQTRQLIEQNLLREQQIQQEMQNAMAQGPYGEFYQGTLRSGQIIESEGSVTIIGDVNPGAKIISAGNIVILGALKGNVHAGCTGERNCFVFALNMNPIQIQIGDLIAKSPDKENTRRRFRRKEKEAPSEAQIAVAKDGAIYIEPITKNILRNI